MFFEERLRLSKFFTNPWLHLFIGKVRNMFYMGNSQRIKAHIQQVVKKESEKNLIRKVNLDYELEFDKVERQREILQMAVKFKS